MSDESPAAPPHDYGEVVRWEPATPRIGLLRTLVSWVVAAASIEIAAWIVPGVALDGTFAAFLVAALIGILNAVLPPVVAALRLPFTLAAGFLLVLVTDALLLVIAGKVLPDDIHVDSFGDALLAAVVISAVIVVLTVVLGTNDDDAYSVRVTRRIARRLGAHEGTDVPGIIFLEIDGLAAPVLRRAIASGHVPNMQRWMDERNGGEKVPARTPQNPLEDAPGSYVMLRLKSAR